MPLDNQTERFYLVDRHDRSLGSISRSQAHVSPEHIHRSICILVFNQNSQLLLQKRSKYKDTYPDFWTLSVTGHVTYGETYLHTAKRELWEEMGLKLALKRLNTLLLELPHESEFSAIYQVKTTNPILVVDPQEISQVEWVDIATLSEFTKENLITPETLLILKHLKYL